MNKAVIEPSLAAHLSRYRRVPPHSMCVSYELAPTPVAVLATTEQVWKVPAREVAESLFCASTYSMYARGVWHLYVRVHGEEQHEVQKVLLGEFPSGFIDAWNDAQKTSEQWLLVVRDAEEAWLLYVETETGYISLKEQVPAGSLSQWYPAPSLVSTYSS